MLNECFTIQNRISSSISTSFKRYLYELINWNHRLVVITGARGTGKTTLVLQHFQEFYKDMRKCLYVSADNPLILKEGIYQVVKEYFKYYGKCVIIDEVHKHSDWSVQVKALYDSYPDKKFIILGSSTLNILFGKGDLSRRAIIYSLPPMSFREYLELKYRKKLEPFSLAKIINNHEVLAGDLTSKFATILGDFNDYLTIGAYPFHINCKPDEYFSILASVLDKVIYEDIMAIKSLKSISSLKLKKLLGFIATSKIPVFNIESLKIEIGVSKDTLYEYFDLLERAEIVTIVRTQSKNIRVFKNSKILFKNPNIYYSIAYELWRTEGDRGNIRESFFVSQMSQKRKLYTSLETDFLCREENKTIEFEVGGKSKKPKKIKESKHILYFKDGIEIGSSHTIPLYLVGFLY